MPTRRTLISTALTLPFATQAHSMHARQATPAVTTESWVPYADREHSPLTLDVYRPARGTSPRAAVLLFHGGAWTYGLGGPHEVAAAGLAAANYVAFIVRYRLTSDPAAEYRWPAQLDDAQEAVRWVRAHADHYGFDPEKIAAYGHSAGGHLASHVGLRDETRSDATAELQDLSSRVQAVISIASHYDLSLPYPGEFDQERINALLGGAPDDVPDVTIDASPITWVKDGATPFLLLSGGIDEMSPAIQTQSMTATLLNAGSDVAIWEDASGDHFNIAEWTQAGPWTLAFLDSVFRD